MNKINLDQEFTVLKKTAKRIISNKILEIRNNAGSFATIEEFNLRYKLQKRFLKEIDGAMHHAPKWHEWGIITHSRKVHQYMFSELLKDKSFYLIAKNYLLEIRDGISRWDLLQLSIPYHDVGKFASPLELSTNLTSWKRDHDGHEYISSQIVTDNQGCVYKNLIQRGLNQKQVAHVAKLCELHYELGKIRNIAKETEGYNLNFLNSAAFADASAKLRAEHPDLAIEIGIWFAMDSMAKTRRNTSKENLREQRQLNVAMAKKYLDSVVS